MKSERYWTCCSSCPVQQKQVDHVVTFHLVIQERISDSIPFFFSSLAGETEAAVALRPAARRNIVLFQGFCAIKYAIYALCVNAHHSSSCSGREAKQHLQKQEGDKTDAEETSTSSEGQSDQTVPLLKKTCNTI